MMVANRRRLEVPHCRGLRKMLYLSWHDKISNKGIKDRMGYGNIIRKRRLMWLGLMWYMGKDRRTDQILHWVHEGRKRRGRLWKNWTETVKYDLRGLEISGERAEELAIYRDEWR